ncbi:flagellar hook-basal body protein [Blastopirellula retiformator]|uniref:Flagellar basal-body rod protein FlgG n=1 Tax=Blastopirellula retiformator TaxID=2527970 RepID=A0A5C5V5J7_9BACT|nr:flagellar hook-basal body protein [Blastopirellula retiformator]TWT33330.1 Flagellar basal-body rod protein FlgG [Blastopirellula retiformator]
MPYGLYIAAEGAQAQAQRVEVLANNIANVDTAGFKRDLAVLQARYSQAIEDGKDYPNSGSINDVGGGVYVSERVTDYARGTLRGTNMPTDLAIEGEGFFQILIDGQKYLTRAGDFTFTAEGNLVTASGNPVLDTQGEPIQVDPEALARHVGDYFDTNGFVTVGGDVVPLSMVKPASLSDLAKYGDTAFYPLAGVQELEIDERQTRPGFLEGSGVNSITEMMTMIEAQRAYEANVNLIKNHDEMLGNLVNRVLRQG